MYSNTPHQSDSVMKGESQLGMREDGSEMGTRTVFDVEGVDVPWDVTEAGEEDVDEQVGTATGYDGYTGRWD